MEGASKKPLPTGTGVSDAGAFFALYGFRCCGGVKRRWPGRPAQAHPNMKSRSLVCQLTSPGRHVSPGPPEQTQIQVRCWMDIAQGCVATANLVFAAPAIVLVSSLSPRRILAGPVAQPLAHSGQPTTRSTDTRLCLHHSDVPWPARTCPGCRAASRVPSTKLHRVLPSPSLFDPS